MTVAARRLLVWALFLATFAIFLYFAFGLKGGWIARYGSSAPVLWFGMVYSDPVKARFALDYMILFNVFLIWAILEIPRQRRLGLWTWLWVVGMYFATALSVMWYFIAQKQHHLMTGAPLKIEARKHKLTGMVRLLLLANLIVYSMLYFYYAFVFKGGWLASPGFWAAFPIYLQPLSYDGYLGTAIVDYLVLIPVYLIWALSELPREQRTQPRTILWALVYLAAPGLGMLLYFLWLQPGNHLASGEAMDVTAGRATNGANDPVIGGSRLAASA